VGRPHGLPVTDRTAYDELAELATMSALAKWLDRWQPIAIHGAMLAGAQPEAVAGVLGSSVEEAYRRWHEWRCGSATSSSAASSGSPRRRTRQLHSGLPPRESNSLRYDRRQPLLCSVAAAPY